MSLFHSLNIGSESLHTSRQGIDSTAHNIANAQTEGYSRQEARITQRDPLERRSILIGNGSYISSIHRSKDKFLEKQINLVNSTFGESEGKNRIIGELESVFSPELASNVSQEMSSFFDTLQNLSNYPEELTVRTAVKEKGENLASAFRAVDADLSRIRDNINEEVKTLSGKLSDMLKGISELNYKIRAGESGSESQSNDLRDQRDLLLRKLSEQINIQYYEDENGMMTVRGPGETLLIDKRFYASFDMRQNTQKDNMYDVIINPITEGGLTHNITDQLKGGSLKGLIDARDHLATDLINQNNELAYTFATEFNNIHQEGFGLRDFGTDSGRSFFDGVDSKVGAAKNIKLDVNILNSTDSIAASSLAHTTGDNINVNRLVQIKSKRLMDNNSATFTEYYSNSIGALGVAAQRSQNNLESNKILLADLKARAEGVSGVSLDEEASNMMRWQSTFTASAKIIKSVDEMLETVLTLKR